MSEPAAARRARLIGALVISNDGASSSRDRTKFEFRETDESSPPQCSSSPTKSEYSTTSTGKSTIYSDSDEQSTWPPRVPREHASEAAARTADAGLTPRPSPELDSLLNEPVPGDPARAGPPKSKSEPTLTSLRLVLASFMSTLFPPSIKWQHRSTSPKAHEDDQKETERLDRWAARRALLPLNLPNQLVLCKRIIHLPSDHGIKIIENCSNLPLLVGHGERSHLRRKFRVVSLCLGGRWYATWTEPFLKAYVRKHQITVKVCDHQLATAPETTVVKAWRVLKDKHAWHFAVGILGTTDKTTTVQEDFVWYSKRHFQLEGDERHRHGSFLIRVSTQKVVAVLERRLRRRGGPSVVSMSFAISFLGSGNQYGGLWKIIVFAIGLCGQ